MKNQTIEFQVKMYVYELDNCAREFGFKADENWEVNMVTSDEKTDLENKYFPTLSAKVLPEMLADMFDSVTFQLDGLKKAFDKVAIREQQLQYIVAYNPGRVRR